MRRLPFLTKSQRRALLVLEWVLLIGIIGYSVWRQTPSNSPLKGEDTSQEVSPLREDVEGSALPKEEPFETFPFDPNTADSTALLRLGLSPWQVRSIYRYRAKRGRYHTPEDFMRVPNMTVEQWERLKDYIRIAPQFRFVEPPPRRAYRKESIQEAPPMTGETKEKDTGKQSASSPEEPSGKAEKLSPGEVIDIGTADTTQLKLIPGIASKRAARIVAYRKQLGGFVNVEQAMEAIEMPDTVLRYMTLAPQPVRKIDVNHLSVQQMMKHPYLSFYQAKAIFEHRRNKGPLHSIEEMEHLDGFKPTDIDRLRPYITFE